MCLGVACTYRRELMAFDRIKRMFGGGGDEEDKLVADMYATLPDVPWVEASENPWGVRLLDVRPVTQTLLSVTTDPKFAANAVSYSQDDGTSFVGQRPKGARTVATNLRFPIDRVLADGVLFTPREMEHKWALFYHRGEIICVRSWLRQVQAVADVQTTGTHMLVTAIHGALASDAGDDEPDELTIRLLDCLLRTHALELLYPVPLPRGMERDPKAAAMWCMNIFGNRALFATPHEFERREPDTPMRSYSRLHLGVARGDLAAIDASLAAGIPIDLLAGDGLAPLHWALVHDDPAIMSLLLERGSPVDVRSSQGATALMNAVQTKSLEKVSFLLDRGADADARDLRGFTALHRAAEAGLMDLVKALIEHGASPNLEAEGHTPLSLAEARGQSAVVALLTQHSAK